MNNYKLTFGIEPTNDYEKAKQDISKALISVYALPPEQRVQLAKELLGAANFELLFDVIKCITQSK